VSDVARLKWSDINTQNGQMKADIRQKKTDEPLYLPLSENAAKWMPERADGGEGEPIFKGLSVSVASHIVKDWARAAGITKNVTFHTARHTFATMLLTKGGDLFTVSKLLGHKEISTTQIYAKIVDQKKNDTVNLLNDVF
jgi:site-specific recombinase XerD